MHAHITGRDAEDAFEARLRKRVLRHQVSGFRCEHVPMIFWFRTWIRGRSRPCRLKLATSSNVTLFYIYIYFITLLIPDLFVTKSHSRPAAEAALSWNQRDVCGGVCGHFPEACCHLHLRRLRRISQRTEVNTPVLQTAAAVDNRYWFSHFLCRIEHIHRLDCV